MKQDTKDTMTKLTGHERVLLEILKFYLRQSTMSDTLAKLIWMQKNHIDKFVSDQKKQDPLMRVLNNEMLERYDEFEKTFSKTEVKK